ncbi:hypothetical protein [Lacticaseibacillus sp. GG6-2]
MLIDIFYMLILIVAIGVSVWLRTQIVIPARPHWFWRWLFIVAAAMVAAATWVTSSTLDGYLTGLFICGMFLVFAAWRRGLTTVSVVNGLGSVRQYTNLSAIQLQQDGTGCLLHAMVGASPIVRLRFAQSPETLAAFLQAHWDPKRVIIIH